MKKSVVMAVLLLGSAAASSLLAQGSIVWGNVFGAATARVLLSPIYGVDPANPMQTRTGNTAAGVPPGTQVYAGALLAGTGFTTQLFSGSTAAEAASSMNPLVNSSGAVSSAPFLTAAGAGLMSQRTVFDPQRPPGTLGVNVQMRAWDNQMGTITSWSEVLARQGTVAGGVSEPFLLATGLGGGTITPPQTLGLRSFQLTVVPEPSLIALGALGLGALLLRRRK